MRAHKSIFTTLGLAAMLVASVAQAAPEWRPAVSDRLVNLPVHEMKRALQQDYQGSELAAAIADSEGVMKKKGEEIKKLTKAMERAGSEATRQDLALRKINEQRALVRLQEEGLALKEERAHSRLATYEKILEKMRFDNRPLSAEDQKLATQRQDAKSRMEASGALVEQSLYDGIPGAQRSRYAAQYASLGAAMEKLRHAITRHPANRLPDGDTPLSKAELVTAMMTEAQGELELIKMEKDLLALMSQKVALDSRALSEDLAPYGKDDLPADVNPTADMVNLYLD